jgi:3-oxoacyl-[acyl-carrier protein] reductase
MNNKRFENRNVLITGGARGLGFEIALHFAREGASLIILDNHRENLSKAQNQLKKETSNVEVHDLDVSNRESVNETIDIIDKKAPIDILINNAGIANETAFLEIEDDEWKKILDINLTGVFYVSQAVCRHMVKRRKGVVINMSSKNGLDGEAGYAHYNSSKGGIIMLTKTMALELAQYGIRVNAVCPGYIQTPMSMEIDDPEFTKNFVDKYIPLNRPGKMNEIAPAFLFLASEENSFMTGQTIVIDGGQLAGQKPF